MRRCRLVNIAWLEAFAGVVRAGGITAAARELGLARSTVADQIRSLEQNLGVLLLIRRGNRLVLTEPGHSLMRHVQPVLEGVALARAEVTQAGRRRTLRIGVPEHVYNHRLPAFLELLRIHPGAPSAGVTVDISARLRAQLRQGELDVALLDDGARALDGIAQRPLWSDRAVLVAPASQPDVSQVRQLLLSRRGCAFRGIAETQVLPVAAAGTRALDVGSLAAVSTGVTSGLGAGVLPPAAVRTMLADGRAVKLRWQPSRSVVVQLAWSERSCPIALQRHLEQLDPRNRTDRPADSHLRPTP